MLTNALPASLRPYAKAVVPGLLTIAAVLIEWAIGGFDAFDRVQFWTAVIGLGSAFYATVIANAPATWAIAAKAILPALGSVLLALIHFAQTGVFDRVSTTAAVTGLLTAVVIYLVPNTPLEHSTSGGSLGVRGTR